jgi:hypothetical protein
MSAPLDDWQAVFPPIEIDRRQPAPKIVTDFWMKPGPSDQFDWSAVDDNTYDGPGCPIGYGATEAEAVADLLEQLEERA